MRNMWRWHGSVLEIHMLQLGFRGTFLGVPIIRTIVFEGLCWGVPIIQGLGSRVLL